MQGSTKTILFVLCRLWIEKAFPLEETDYDKAALNVKDAKLGLGFFFSVSWKYTGKREFRIASELQLQCYVSPIWSIVAVVFRSHDTP